MMKRDLGAWELDIRWTGKVVDSTMYDFKVFVQGEGEQAVEITAMLTSKMHEEMAQTAIEAYEANAGKECDDF